MFIMHGVRKTRATAQTKFSIFCILKKMIKI